MCVPAIIMIVSRQPLSSLLPRWKLPHGMTEAEPEELSVLGQKPVGKAEVQKQGRSWGGRAQRPPQPGSAGC